MITVVDPRGSELSQRFSKGLCNRVERDTEIERMRESALFAGLSSEECEEVFRCAKNQTYHRGEVLFSQGEIVDRWVLIQTGRVKLSQLNPEGSEIIVWLKNSGDAIGIQFDIFGSAHSCFARAMERCQTLVWDRRGIQAVLAHCPQVRGNIIEILGIQLRELEERFCKIAGECVADRLALLLQRLCNSVGKQSR